MWEASDIALTFFLISFPFPKANMYLQYFGKERFKKNVDGANVYFKFFSGANIKQLDYYVVPALADESPDSVITHIGSNDITKSSYNNVNVEKLAKKIINIELNYKTYKVCNIAISSIFVRSDPKINQVIKQVNRLLQDLCKTNNIYFICNNAIDNTFLWKVGLHLIYERFFFSFYTIDLHNDNTKTKGSLN